MNSGEHRDETRLEEAFSTDDWHRAPDGSCPSEDRLWASAAGELSPTEDETVILHLARCGECSSIWRLAREILPEDHLSDATVVSFENRRRPRLWRRVLLPAAAAAILVGVGLSTGLFQRNDAPTSPVFREQRDGFTIVASEATGSLARSECRLRWNAGPDGTRYDLIVTDGALEILATVNGLEQPEHRLPEEMIPDSATELFWRVTAHLPDGTTVSSDTFKSSITGASSTTTP